MLAKFPLALPVLIVVFTLAPVSAQSSETNQLLFTGQMFRGKEIVCRQGPKRTRPGVIKRNHWVKWRRVFKRRQKTRKRLKAICAQQSEHDLGPPAQSPQERKTETPLDGMGPLELLLEAEHSTLKRGAQIDTDLNASNEKSVGFPATLLPNLNGANPDPARIIFTLAVRQPIAMEVKAKLLAPDETSNSYFVQIDNQEPELWEIDPSVELKEHTLGSFSFSKGIHTISFILREPGCAIDYLHFGEITGEDNPPEPSGLESFIQETGLLAVRLPKLPRGGNTYLISNQSELDLVAESIEPGDQIIIAEGDYENVTLAFPAAISGTESSPVVIRPSRNGETRFRGESKVVLSGDHCILAGLDFLGAGYHALKIEGDHNRITQNRFISSGNRYEYPSGVMIVGGTADYNEFDRNLFLQTEGISIILAQPGVSSTAPSPKHNYFHHNTFQDIPQVYPNGGEAMMLGYGYHPADVVPGHDDETFTAVENNLFLRANGDSEIISIKSSRVTIRNNAFVDCHRGTITFRQSHDSLVEHNLLLNTGHGIRITGIGNQVVNNVIYPLNSGGGILLMDGSLNPDSGLTNYEAARNNLVAHNTLVGSHSALYFLKGAGDLVEEASNNDIVNNIFALRDSASGLVVSSSSTYTPLEGYARNNVVNNIIWAEGDALIIPDDGLNILAPPLLTSATGDFPFPLPASPAIDTALPEIAAVDFFGAMRPSSPDIGAFELFN